MVFIIMVIYAMYFMELFIIYVFLVCVSYTFMYLCILYLWYLLESICTCLY